MINEKKTEIMHLEILVQLLLQFSLSQPVELLVELFILCSQVTTMATWTANADRMVTNTGQPGELQPC